MPPGPACGTPGASGANDVGGRLGTAAWARPPGHGRLGMAATGDAFARRLG
ncbi:hypothetical protein [Delftia tsuruhatensis]|uniref:hypothetical protein n=1 Tax=Delftia tsuruhatensis TaxID=180282 RepID=UPI00370CD132